MIFFPAYLQTLGSSQPQVGSTPGLLKEKSSTSKLSTSKLGTSKTFTFMETASMKNGSRVIFMSVFLIIASLLVGYATSAFGQSNAAMAEQLAARAEVIAIGKVTGVESEWNESHTMIRTRVTLSVDQFVKGGSSQNAMTIYVPGGEIDGVGEIYSHMPTFRRDEDVVVFAEKDRENRYRVSAGSQGKFLVEKNSVTGKAMIAGGRSLDDLKAQLHLVIQQQGTKR